MRYFLGIDNGGTMTKAALFDLKGKEIASASENTPVLTPKTGYYERDMLLLWRATARTIQKAINKGGIDPADIAGVGCTGHGKGLYLWGKDDKPAYHAIASTDHRAAAITDYWRKDGTADHVKQLTLQNVIECQPAPLLAWLKKEQPDTYANIKWIFEAKDYVRFMLTGEAYAEATDYSGTSLMNLKTQQFDPEILHILGLEEIEECLPPLRYSYENCGYITALASQETGLKEGTPVCGGMFDIDACAIAMDVSSEEKLCTITGTWSINEYLSKTPVTPNSSTLNSLFCIPGYYLIEESSPTSAGNLEWFIDNFLQKEIIDAKAAGQFVYRYIDDTVANTPMSELLFLPFLYGSNCEGCTTSALVGMTSANSQADVFRAVFEGVAFSHLSHIEKLLKRREKPKAIRIAGGVVNSAVWLQIFADVIGIPLEVVTTKELGALGCAMAAAVSIGEYQDYSDAAQAMVSVKETIQPNMEMHEKYRKKYERYQKLATLFSQLK